METNKNLKAFFALFVTTITAFSLYCHQKGIEMPVSKVKVPFFTTNELHKLDPANITDSTESNLIRSIYATLIYFDTNGRIRPGGASKFDVVDNKVRFHIRDNMKTRDGYLVTAEDVYLSFKRLLILNKNTHGKLINFLECNPLPKKITDICGGISFYENIFEISLKSPNHISFFLSMLANPDFAIIPKISVAYSEPEMKIVDLKNTSGAYYVEDHNEKHAHFKVNLSNYLIDEKNPNEIEVTFNVGDERDNDFSVGKYDVIPTFAIVTQKNLNSFGDLSRFNVHKTLPIQLTYIGFKKTGSNILSIDERVSAGTALKNAYLAKFKDQFDLIETDQYFVVVGEGELPKDQLNKIKDAFKGMKPLKRTVTADIANMWPQKAKPVVTTIENFEYKELKNLSDEQTEKSPQLYILSTDAGGFDNISLLSYLQSLKHFGMSDSEFALWLDDYIGTENESLRLKKFRDLHFKMLIEAQVIPVGVESYYGIARKPWKIEAYQMFAGSPFWTIKREQ